MSVILCQECKQPDNLCLRTYPQSTPPGFSKHFIPDLDILQVDPPETLNGRVQLLTKEEVKWNVLCTVNGHHIFPGNPLLTFAYPTIKKCNVIDDQVSHDDPNILKTHYDLRLESHKLNVLNPIPTLEVVFSLFGRCLVPVTDTRVGYVVVTNIEEGKIHLLDCFHNRGLIMASDCFKKIISFAKPVIQIPERGTILKVETYPISQGNSPKDSPRPFSPSPQSPILSVATGSGTSTPPKTGTSTPPTPKMRSRGNSTLFDIQEDS